jgi:hypothetical protein
MPSMRKDICNRIYLLDSPSRRKDICSLQIEIIASITLDDRRYLPSQAFKDICKRSVQLGRKFVKIEASTYAGIS